MIAPMLAGVVYFSVLPDYVFLLNDLNIRRVYYHSFWAETGTGDNILYHDCHCLAGLSSFANAFKMVVFGSNRPGPKDNGLLIQNRNRVGKRFRELWVPKGGKIRLVIGQVMDDKPPISAWVPIDDFLAGTVPSDYPVVRYTQVERDLQ